MKRNYLNKIEKHPYLRECISRFVGHAIMRRKEDQAYAVTCIERVLNGVHGKHFKD